VDHEIQNDVDVKAARAEQAQAVNFEKERIADDPPESGDRRVEAFKMAYLKDAAVPRCSVDQPLGAGEVRGDRFFDQNVDALLEQRTPNIRVGPSRSRHDCRIYLAPERTGFGERLTVILRGEVCRTMGVSINDGTNGSVLQVVEDA
jgi:hypothetical protein